MKPIDEVKRRWDDTKKDEERRPCPFVFGNSVLGLWGSVSYYCGLVNYGKFTEPCTFKDFNKCPLFPRRN
jgi:hypothetical protein